MGAKVYSQRLGLISDEQFQAALDRFNLGRFVRAQPIPFGQFGQNVFVSSTEGEYVLRGDPHFWWQFPTEQFYTRLLHERTHVPVPWPYLIDVSTEIFGWSYALMPRMPGLQLADPQVKTQLEPEASIGIARALGENLAHMQQATWPFSGRYDASTGSIQPFDLAHEIAWPFPVNSDPQLASIPPTTISYGERVQACLRHNIARAREHNEDATTLDDIAWVEGVIAAAQDALAEPFEPCFVMEDYKEGNLVVQNNAGWRVSGVFDLMGGYFAMVKLTSRAPLPNILTKIRNWPVSFCAAI
jgi:aminoglycoside phosphotransferase (APT) family kinase protein